MVSQDKAEVRLSEERFSIPSSELGDWDDAIDELLPPDAGTKQPTPEAQPDPVMTKPPRMIQRPTSSGVANVTADFQFSVAPKMKPKLTRPSKDNGFSTPPEQHPFQEGKLSENNGNDSTKTNERASQSELESRLLKSSREKRHEAHTQGGGRTSSVAVGAHGLVSSVQSFGNNEAANTLQGSVIPFDARPRTLSRTPDTIETTSITNPVEDIRTIPVERPDESLHQPLGQNTEDHKKGGNCTPPGRCQNPRELANSDLKLPQSMHLVISGKIVKPKSPKNAQYKGGLPSPHESTSESELSNDQILQIYLRRVHAEKDHTDRKNRSMKNQIEKLVRINKDYQNRLDEVEQDLNEREAQIEQQSAEVGKWRKQVLHFKETLKEMKGGHSDLRNAMDVLKQNSEGLPREIKSLQAEIRECSSITSAISAKTSKTLSSTAQNHQHQIVSMEGKLKLVKKDFIDRSSQLTKEQARVVRLENFIADELKSMGRTITLASLDLNPLTTRLRSLESLVEKSLEQGRARIADLNASVPGVDQCLDLLKSLGEKESIHSTDLQPIMTAITHVEDKLTDCMRKTQQCSETVVEGTSQIETQLRAQAMEIKKTIDTFGLTMSDQSQLEKEKVQYTEVARGHLNTLAQAQKALDFAQQQASVPQDLIRNLSTQIADFKEIFAKEAKQKEEEKKRIIDEGRKIQNLNSRLEEEKSKTTLLKESSESQNRKLLQKENELGELKKAHAQVEIELLQAQGTVAETVRMSQEKAKELSDNNDKVAILEKELQDLKGADDKQRFALKELNTKLEGKEVIQKQLNLLIQEKGKVDLKVADFERRLRDYEALQTKCNRLSDMNKLFEDQKGELQNSIEQNVSLKESLSKKEEEIMEIRAKLEAVKKELDHSKPAIAGRLSQEIPESISQDNLTPGTLAAFHELIDPDMLDENTFQSFDSRSNGHDKNKAGAGMPLQKADRSTVDVAQSAPRLRVQPSHSPEPSASQRTILIPESQPMPIAVQKNNVTCPIDRSSSLTPLSDVESLFEAVIQGGTADRPESQVRRQSIPWKSRSMNTTHSDEMLLEGDPADRAESTRSRQYRKRNPANSGKDSRSTSDLSHRSLRKEVSSKPTGIPPHQAQPHSAARDAVRSSKSTSERPSPNHSAVEESLPRNVRTPLRERDTNFGTNISNNTTKEKPRPNSAAKRQASSVEDPSSPLRLTAKRMKRNPSAVETKEDHISSSIGSQTHRTASPSKQIIRHSLPTGSKGSSSRPAGSAKASSQTKRTKKSKSQAYDERFGR